jgi:hypothetical protein
MNNLPKFFMISKSNGYKFYKNTIMFPQVNSYNPVNVVSCLLNTRIQYVSRHTCQQAEIDGTLSKDSLVTRLFPFKGKFTGYEISIVMNGSEITVPGISFSECDQRLLPSGSPVISSQTSLVRWQARPRPYIEADVLVEDDLPIAPVVMAPVAAAVVVPVSTSRISVYPAHIKQLIIADSIQKNECCSITGDPISQENACITTCGHVFTRTGLSGWFRSSSNSICPLCRQQCQI